MAAREALWAVHALQLNLRHCYVLFDRNCRILRPAVVALLVSRWLWQRVILSTVGHSNRLLHRRNRLHIKPFFRWLRPARPICAQELSLE